MNIEAEPIGWMYEDELPSGYPYDAMFPYSKVDFVRMFPVYAPTEVQKTSSGGHFDDAIAYITKSQVSNTKSKPKRLDEIYRELHAEKNNQERELKTEPSGATHIYSTGATTAKPDAIQYDKDGNEMAHWNFDTSTLPKREPVGWITEDYKTDKSATTYDKTVADRWKNKGWPVNPIYAAPPQREWVGLTEMDMLELDRKYYPRTFELMIAVEAKLKEKNT